MKSSQKPMVLAGDVGGTKTHVGLFRRGKHRPAAVTVETFPSADFRGLEEILARFLEHRREPVAAGCFGIAGPVIKGKSKTTNLPWRISESRLKSRFKWQQVQLINDLSATALAVPLLRSDELLSLNRARADRNGNLAVVAPGTGLGQALLVSHRGTHLPVASEGGHVDFAPAGEAQVELWRFLRKRFGHVSVERIVSGPGLFHIYGWLKASGRYREPKWLGEAMSGTDPAKVITETALRQNQPMCTAALEQFVSILGAVAGNLALTGLTTGGVYLGGGIPPKILPKLQEQNQFMEAFVDKGRFRQLMEQIPVRVILNDRSALLGAARAAFESLSPSSQP